MEIVFIFTIPKIQNQTKKMGFQKNVKHPHLKAKKYIHTFLFLTGKKSKFLFPAISSSDSSSSASSSSESENSSDNNTVLEEAPKKQRTSNPGKIPKQKYGSRTKAEIDRMRADFPNLNHHTDETFRTLSWTELIRLDNKLESNSKSTKKLTEKLAKNLDKLKKTPTKVEAGEDNRSNILHSARFLGGHTCCNSEIWLNARKTIGLTGLEPVSRYDSESVGLNGNINSHIWACLHNPGSKEISIKMLSPNGIKETRGTAEKNGAAIKKDFEEIGEIKLALATLRAASQFVNPWNFSWVSLEYFLISVHFGKKDLPNKNNRISFISDFIDEVVLHNAEAWDDAKNFMQATEISNKWVSEIMLKFPRGTQYSEPYDKKKNQRNTQQQGKPQQNTQQNNSAQKSPPKTYQGGRPYIPGGLCRRFNYNICPSQANDSCQATWDHNISLKHQCAHFDNIAKKYCLDRHSLTDHK
jgi:hypothetical protein